MIQILSIERCTKCDHPAVHVLVQGLISRGALSIHGEVEELPQGGQAPDEKAAVQSVGSVDAARVVLLAIRLCPGAVVVARREAGDLRVKENLEGEEAHSEPFPKGRVMGISLIDLLLSVTYNLLPWVSLFQFPVFRNYVLLPVKHHSVEGVGE